jgi:CRP/FNR family transcriptional regulator, nitrogen oxide reductase regulator
MPATPEAHRTTPLEVEDTEPLTCSPARRLALLGQVALFRKLSREELGRVNELFQETGFQPGEMIYAAGDPATRLYVVLAGKVKVVRHTLAGQDVMLDLLDSGGFFGSLSVFGDDEYPDTVYAQTACCVISIEARDFQSVLQRYPPVALAVLETVEKRLHEAHDVIRQLSAEPVESRVAGALLKLADRMGRPEGDRVLIQTPLSRQDLANMVGTTLETASRVISQFRKAGLIDSGRQWIAIRNRAGLAAIAGPESAHLAPYAAQG